MTENLEEKFKELAIDWKKHVRANGHMSNTAEYTDCSSYRQIISMGNKALPLILNQIVIGRESYQGIVKDEELATQPCNLWCLAVKEIMGEEFSIPEEMRGNGDKIVRYTASWLENHLSKVK